ncbi:hypothetical protein [Nocardia grenadensis]
MIRRMKPLGFTLAEMKQLLDAFEVLDDPAATGEKRTQATEFLRQCRERTRDSADRLRRHLTYAEEFGDLLTARSGWAGSS